jgi:hypothetical protein
VRREHRQLGAALGGLEAEIQRVADLAAQLGWFDVSSALYAEVRYVRAWNVDITYDGLEIEEARRGQLRLDGPGMGQRHDVPTEDLPF